MSGLEGDVKIPGAGNVPKKYVIGAVATAAGIAIIMYFRSKAAAKAAVPAAGNVTDPAGNTCTALDPNSGYCPGSPEDQSYQANALGTGTLTSGYGGGTGYAGTGVPTAGLVTDPAGNQCSTVNPATGYCPGTAADLAATGITGTGSGTGTETNAEWMAAVLKVLPGGDTSANEAALRGVLGGQTVTTAQLSTFNLAVGLEGQPPQGYPTPVKTSDTSGHPGGGGSKAAGPISNLVEVARSPTSASIRWNAAPGATDGYAYELRGPTPKSGTTRQTSVAFHGLAKGTYTFGVQGLPGGPGNNIPITL